MVFLKMTWKFFPSASMAASALTALDKSMAILTKGGSPSFRAVQRSADTTAGVSAAEAERNPEKTRANKKVKSTIIFFIKILPVITGL